MQDRKLLTRLLLFTLMLVKFGALDVQALSNISDNKNQWGFIDANTGEIDFEHHHESSIESQKKIVLLKADTSACRIGRDDRTLLQTDPRLVDFVTAFNGNDFECSVVSANGHGECCDGKALRILPANGSSFTTSVPPVPLPGPVEGGLFDHVKFLAYSIDAAAPECEGNLSTTWVASGAQLNVNRQPFGVAVSNPDEDPRLATVALTVLDNDLLLTFDFFITNEIVYAIVERLPLVGTTYAAYTYLIPLYKFDCNVDPLNNVHKYESRYNYSEHTMTWLIDNRPLLQINEFGVRLNERNAFIFDKHGEKKCLKNPNRFKVLEHGGIDTPLLPTNLRTGLAFFTLLDAYRPNNILGLDDATTEGLVRLESNRFRAPGIFFYYDPLTYDSNPVEASFVEDSALDVPTQQYLPTIPSRFRIFGQGAELRLFHYDVSIKE